MSCRHRPVSKIDQTTDCFIARSVRMAFPSLIYRGKGQYDSMTADQCYSCNKFFAEKKNLERHLKVCGSMSRITEKFENQNISSFGDNVRFIRELPFAVYFDLETTSGKKIYEFHQEVKMYPVSYAFVIAFNPYLKPDRISVVRSFNHSFEQLTDVSYLLDEMINFSIQ